MPVEYHYGKFPPHQYIDWTELIELLEPASSALARYDGVLSGVPNSALLFSPLTTQEAVLSSQIEGTQATMGEVLKFEANADGNDISEDKKNDIYEILNYRKAIRYVMDELKTTPLCQRVIKEAHRILMDSVRGNSKAPGEYRRIPNWIGPIGCTIENANYIPISADKLDEGMSEWEKYMHAESKSRLVQLAILHAEFEALHPFLDGNGRLGRMLVPLFLSYSGMIQSPMFYISAYFEANKTEYYQKLRGISSEGNWTEWCRFFLKAVKYQSEMNRKKALLIIELYNKMKQDVVKHTHSQYGIIALDLIFERPIFRGTDFICCGKIPEATARRLLNNFKDAEIISVMKEASGRRPATYSFNNVLNIAEGYDAF